MERFKGLHRFRKRLVTSDSNLTEIEIDEENEMEDNNFHLESPDHIDFDTFENIESNTVSLNQLPFNAFLNAATLLSGDVIIEPDNHWSNKPLYDGCLWKVMDLVLLIEMFKVVGKLGDGFENCLLGLIASVMPVPNVLASQFQATTKSNYFFQKILKSGHSKFKKMRVFSIPACRKGCCAFIGNLSDAESCPKCNLPNDSTSNDVVYYFPLFDRLVGLITSDLKRFLVYENIRQTPSPGYLEDVYDGTTWKWFKDQMGPGEVLIGLTFCWDGADMFNKSGKCIWPLSISILNFPQELRTKLNIGLHVVAMCTGTMYIVTYLLHIVYIYITFPLHFFYPCFCLLYTHLFIIEHP